MPISAQEWRIRTGMITASRSRPFFTSTIASTPRALPGVKHNHKTGLPPPTWTGYRAAMVMLSVPMMYKFYTAILAVLVYIFKDSTVARTQHTTELANHNDANFGYHCFLLSLLSLLYVLVHAVIVMVLVVMNDREQLDNCLWISRSRSGSLQCVDGSHSGRVTQNSWGSLCLSLQSLAGSVVHHLPTLALLMLVLLCGDVETNPGPQELEIKTLMEKLSSVKSKWHSIGIQLGVEVSQLHDIEDQYSDIGRRLTETLQYWLDGNTEVPICWESIVEVLKCVDKKGLAEQLHDEYCKSGESSQAKAPHLAYGRQASFLCLTDCADPLKREQLEARLLADSTKMMVKFQDLLNTVIRSLETRQVPLKRIITQIMTFGAFDPVRQKPDQPILEHELDKLRAEAGTSIDDIQYVVMKYSSFFNYHIVEQIIKALGTPEDMEQFEEYERAFREYAKKRKVIECPSQVAFIDDTNQRRISVKLDDSYNGCTVSQLKLFVGKLSEVFHLKEGVLQLVNVKSGCFELTFQVPLFVQKAIFPLSLEQEKSLTQLGVVKLCTGSGGSLFAYSWSQSGLDDKEDGGDDEIKPVPRPTDIPGSPSAPAFVKPSVMIGAPSLVIDRHISFPSLGHPLDIIILMEKLSSVKSKWHLIGIQLGVKLSQLHLIEDQYSDIGRRLTETLQYWLDGNTEVPICWESIIEVLKCVDKKGLADQLHDEYCTVKRVEGSLSAPAFVKPSEMIGAPSLTIGRHISFPSLGLGGHSGPTYEHLQARLYTDSVRMMGKFQTLLNTIMASLEARQIPVKRIIAQISAFGTFAPVCHVPDQPILKYELDKLRAEPSTSIDDIHFVVAKYSSFFNYHIVEQIIKNLGTPEDMEKLEEYERAFQEYAERKVIECPSQVALIDDTNQTRIFVKLDDSYDGCTVSQLKLFVGKLSNIFNLNEGMLQLVNVNSGCFELTFQVPLSVHVQKTFPLSLEQEKVLLQLKVLELCSGSYMFSCSQSDDQEDMRDEMDDKKVTNNDSTAIEGGSLG